MRYRVFKERLGWDVETAGDMEVDEFDALMPAYLLLRGYDGGLLGCVRFLPSDGPTDVEHRLSGALAGRTDSGLGRCLGKQPLRA